MKKIFSIIYFILMGIIIFISDDYTKYSTALEYIKCGTAGGIPKIIPQLVTTLYSILMIGIPLVLITFGIIVLIKAVASGNADNISKARGSLAKRFLSAAIAFAILFVVQTIFGMVSNPNDASDKTSVQQCIKCFLSYSESNCLKSDNENDVHRGSEYQPYEGEKISTPGVPANSTPSYSKDKKLKILFVGNSLTFKQSDPKLRVSVVFTELARSAGYDVEMTKAYKSGAKLSDVAAANKSVIGGSTYDIAILQEETGITESTSTSTYLKGAKEVVNLLKNKSPNVDLYLRTSWGHKKNLGTSTQQRVFSNAKTVAGQIGATIIPDGQAFLNSHNKYPNINLYSDTVHTTPESTYLAAACIFKKVFNESPVGISYTATISKDTAKKMQEIADSTCGGVSSTKPNTQGKTVASTGTGLGKAKSISIKYNVKDKEGRCGKASSDKCVEVADVVYGNGTKITYYMGYQNNSGLLGGSCRSHAFTCATNATLGTKYSTLDLQKYLKSTGDGGVLRKKPVFTKAINHFKVNAKAYFEDVSIKESIKMAKTAVDNGQPVIIFVAHSKCPDLAGSHHAILLLGYDSNNNVIFLDSVGRYKNAKKRTFSGLEKCMSNDGIAKNWMRMTIFSF